MADMVWSGYVRFPIIQSQYSFLCWLVWYVILDTQAPDLATGGGGLQVDPRRLPRVALMLLVLGFALLNWIGRLN